MDFGGINARIHSPDQCPGRDESPRSSLLPDAAGGGASAFVAACSPGQPRCLRDPVLPSGPEVDGHTGRQDPPQ